MGLEAWRRVRATGSMERGHGQPSHPQDKISALGLAGARGSAMGWNQAHFTTRMLIFSDKLCRPRESQG